MVVVVDACTDLANPVWEPIKTNICTGGSDYFFDSKWTNYFCVTIVSVSNGSNISTL